MNAPITKRLSPLISRLRRFERPGGGLVSVMLVGSAASGKARPYSDLDLLFVTEDEVATDEIAAIGDALRGGLQDCFQQRGILLLHSPAQARPDLAPDEPQQVQVLLHRLGWVQHSLEVRNWVFVSWARNHQVLLGTDLLAGHDTPELNRSIIDQFDGLPSLVRRLDTALLTVGLGPDSNYARKLALHAVARLSELRETFPDVFGKLQQVACESDDTSEIVRHIRTDLHRAIAFVRAHLDAS